jgi:hypothetical protein
MKGLICSVLLCAVSARAAEIEPEETWRSRRVHLLSDDERVELHRRAAGMAEVFVCRMPCNAAVPFHSSDQFVLTGPGILTSAPFQFQLREEDLTLHVSAGTTAPIIIGGTLLGGGWITAVIGGVTYLGEAVFGTVFCDQDPQCIADHASRKSTARTVSFTGLALVAVGGAVLLIGVHPTRFTSQP